MPRNRNRNRTSLTIETIPTNMLLPWDRNPRKISAQARAALGASLRRFGLVEPIVVAPRPGGKHQVLGGHQRLKLLVEQGATEVPCSVVTLSAAEETALALQLNNPQAQGAFTDELNGLIEELSRDAGLDQSALDELLLSASLSATNTIPSERISVARPIKTVWVLLGIPATRYAQHAAAVESISADPEVNSANKAD